MAINVLGLSESKIPRSEKGMKRKTTQCFRTGSTGEPM
jgi:hypothetical protein